MSRYLVTGGCGFIGSHLTDALLNQGHDVIVLDNLSTGYLKNMNKNAELIEGDICDTNQVAKAMTSCDGCFHLAAVASVQQSVKHWVKTNRSNLAGTITLLDMAKNINREHPFSFVYASSAAVYGANKNLRPFKETDELAPISPYGADKVSCEMQARIAGMLHQLPNTGLRLFNVYGERQNPDSDYSGVVSILLNSIKNKTPFTIFGDGEQVRDYIYVQDVISFMIQAMKHANTDSMVFNVCNGEGTTLNQLVDKLGRFSDLPEIHYTSARAGDIRISTGDNTLVKTKLALPKATPLTEGLKKLSEYMEL
jgi:UDP-glucose 4-epimerase